MIRMISVSLVLMVCMMTVAPVSAAGIASGTFEVNEYIIYVPENLQEGLTYPLITAFSPSANAKSLIKTWAPHADRNKCIIMASKLIKNGMNIPIYLKRYRKLIHEKVAAEYPVNLNKVIALGTSGGGMASHLFCFFHPDTVAAVITSVGYIHENSLKQKDVYPKGKVCAFCTSPTDFNYKLMKEDKKFLDSLEWETRWYEFEGGHRTAPEDIREEALSWVIANL